MNDEKYKKCFKAASFVIDTYKKVQIDLK